MVEEKLLVRLRQSLSKTRQVTEKKMFGGICFMVQDKMCVCARNDEIMCRVGPDQFEKAISKKGVRPMIHNGRTMAGYVFVNADSIKSKASLDSWVNMCLAFNKEVPAKKSSSRKSSSRKGRTLKTERKTKRVRK